MSTNDVLFASDIGGILNKAHDDHMATPQRGDYASTARTHGVEKLGGSTDILLKIRLNYAQRPYFSVATVGLDWGRMARVIGTLPRRQHAHRGGYRAA